MKLLILLTLLGGCVSKDWRVIQCAKDNPSKCAMAIWPHTESWCKEYVERKNKEYVHTILKCKQVSK